MENATAGLPKVHVHLEVSDLAHSRAFYERLFGRPPVKATADYAKFLPELAPINLALTAATAATAARADAAATAEAAVAGGRLSHLGVQLHSRAALCAERTRIAAAGLAVLDEQAVDCCYANQDKFWVSDPDGVRWELYHLNYDLPLADAPATGCCAV